MRNRLTSLVLLGASCGLGSAAIAAEQAASYSANGKCYCNLPIPSELDGEIISTPIGGQSLTQVCDRVGTGPELKKTATGFNFPVYGDMQCGHGPGSTDFTALMQNAGMKKGEVGPKWDLEEAYATRAQNDMSSVDDTVVSNTSAIEPAGNVLRFKSRYVKPAVSSNSSKVQTAQSSANATSVSKATASTLQNDQIATLPSATVESLESTEAFESANASVANPRILNTAENSTGVAQGDTALMSEEAETVAKSVNKALTTTETAASTAIRVPAPLSARSRQFDYLSVLPMSYDFGGNGIQLSASSLYGENVRILARAGLADDYQEALIGAGYLMPVGDSDRLSIGIAGGFEYGRFDLQSGSVTTNSSSGGIFVRASSMFAVNRRFELEGGVGYSSFYEGDPHVFGAALFHVTQKLDFVGEFEAGDNDSAGLGIRYFYR